MKTKLISLLLLATLVCSLFAGCSLGRGNTNTGGESGGDVYPTLDLYFHYIPKKTSYAKVEVIDFNGGVYTREQKIPDGVWQERCMIARCKIQEDYYETLAAGTEITAVIPIRFYSSEETRFDTLCSEMRDIFTNSESLLIYLPQGVDYIKYDYYLDGEKAEIEDSTRYVQLEDYYTIPINDGKLQLARIDSLFDKLDIELDNFFKPFIVRYMDGYDDYFRDGMTEDELRESIKNLRGFAKVDVEDHGLIYQYFSNDKDVNISFVEYDSTPGKQDLVLKITNKSDKNYYFYAWFNIMKEGKDGWESYNEAYNSKSFDDLGGSDEFTTLYRTVAPHSEIEFSTYNDMIVSESLELQSPGVYKLEFRAVPLDKEGYYPIDGVITLDVNLKE